MITKKSKMWPIILLLSTIVGAIALFMDKQQSDATQTIRDKEAKNERANHAEKLEDVKEDVIREFKKSLGLKENVEELLKQLLGEEYEDKLNDDETRSNLLKALNGRSIEKLIFETQYIEREIIPKIDEKFRLKIVELATKFDYDGMLKEVNSYLKKNGNLTSGDISVLHFIKVIPLLLLDRDSDAMNEAMLVIKLENTVLLKGLILEIFSNFGKNELVRELIKEIIGSLDDEQIQNDPDLPGLLLGVIFASVNAKQFEFALFTAQNALDLVRKHNGEIHENTGFVHLYLAQIYMRIGKRKESLKHLKHALNVSNSISPKNITLNISVNNAMGEIMFFDGKYGEALIYLTKAESFINSNQEHVPDIGRYKTYLGLGNVYTVTGQFEKAKYAYDECFKRIPLTYKLDRSIYFGSMGNYYDKQGLYVEAIDYYEKQIKLLYELFPNGNPEIKMIEKNLSNSKMKLNKQRSNN